MIAMQKGLVRVDTPTCDAEGVRVLSDAIVSALARHELLVVRAMATLSRDEPDRQRPHPVPAPRRGAGVMAVMSATLLRWTKRQGGGSATRPSACHFIRCG